MLTVDQIKGMTPEQIAAAFAKVQADNQRKVSLKVTVEKTDEKTGKVTGTNGAIAMYGLGRFPVTLYLSQWERVIEAIKSGQLDRFIEANRPALSVKD